MTGRYDRDIGDLLRWQDEITTICRPALAPRSSRAEAFSPPVILHRSDRMDRS